MQNKRNPTKFMAYIPVGPVQLVDLIRASSGKAMTCANATWHDTSMQVWLQRGFQVADATTLHRTDLHESGQTYCDILWSFLGHLMDVCEHLKTNCPSDRHMEPTSNPSEARLKE